MTDALESNDAEDRKLRERLASRVGRQVEGVASVRPATRDGWVSWVGLGVDTSLAPILTATLAFNATLSAQGRRRARATGLATRMALAVTEHEAHLFRTRAMGRIISDHITAVPYGMVTKVTLGQKNSPMIGASLVKVTIELTDGSNIKLVGDADHRRVLEQLQARAAAVPVGTVAPPAAVPDNPGRDGGTQQLQLPFKARSRPTGPVQPMTTPRKDEKFTQKVVRRIKQFDRWVGRQVGRLEPHQRRTLAILMGACAALSVAVGGVVYLVMKRNGTLPPESESGPFSTGVGIAVIFGYVGVKALRYNEAALTAEQHYQRELRDVWKQERPLRDIKPWSQFMAWPQPQAGGVAVLIIRRDPDGGFTAETFDTLPADSSAETGANLIWEARRHAEQDELGAIAAHELAQTRERHALSAPRNAEQKARADTQAAQRASRTAAELAGADVQDRRIEAEGLAAAMRGTARNPLH